VTVSRNCLSICSVIQTTLCSRRAAREANR
jgi:hypothetical protein